MILPFFHRGGKWQERPLLNYQTSPGRCPAGLRAKGDLMTRILVADDEREVREVIKQTLSDQGYQVMEAADGDEAYRMVAAPTTAVGLVLL